LIMAFECYGVIFLFEWVLIGVVIEYDINYPKQDNNNNDNTNICKAHIVSIRAESEAPAVARWRG